VTAPILVIDQGTTSTRAIVFGPDMTPLGQAQQEFPQHYPPPGWGEHDPEDLWTTTIATARAALAQADIPAVGLAAIGIANQRETTLVWDRQTGQPIYNAIVWQDRRTADACDALERDGHGPWVRQRTGLRLDPYFSATKIAWILDHVPGARRRAEQGALAFGTVDTFLLWRLTGGRVFATDATNASRTLLCNLATGAWDTEMLRLFGIPAAMLPEIRDSAGAFGITDAALLGAAIPVRGMVGDQQAALVGQACFTRGMVKATYGTGAFILLNIGAEPRQSANGMVTTIAYQRRGQRSYALEGSIFTAGAAVQWLRDGMGLVASAAETGEMAAQADPAQRVYVVPAFTGLGAPHWNSRVRATISGITRGTTPKEFARAVLEAVGYQTRDLLQAMLDDAGLTGDITLRVDGGMSASDWTMQFLADMVGVVVERPAYLETTALGAGYLAGLEAGIYPEPEIFQRLWARQAAFLPGLDPAERAAKYAGWRIAVTGALHGTS
jgi:glycerol kinase